MKTLHRQLVLNKREDWNPTLCVGIVPAGDGLTLGPGRQHGAVCLPAVDSGENGFCWGRLTLDDSLPEDSLIRTYAYASDSRVFSDSADLDGLLSGLDEKSVNGLQGILGSSFSAQGAGDDCYLSVTGRYLWLMFEFYAPARPPKLNGVRIHVSGDHMLDYLPAIYRKDDGFTKRFLSVFDSILIDMEKEIYSLPARFDYENAGAEVLPRLAEWVCMDDPGGDRDNVVARIRTALSDYESMYTVEGVKRSVKRLTGREPLIIESAEVDPNRPDCANSALYRELYGENPYKFFVLLGEDTFESHEQMEEFLTKMRGLIPAGTEFELVLLKRCVQLDWHTYLGVNAMVSDYVPVVIDENKTIHYDTMIGGN